MGGTISTHAISASSYKNLPCDPVKDFEPVSLVAFLPNVLLVSTQLGVNSVAELVAPLKKEPARRTFASSGAGTSKHLAGQVPAGLIHDHDDEFLGMALCHLRKKHGHRLGIDPGQHQAVERSIMGAHGTEGVEAVALQSCARHGAGAVRRPAAPWRSQQPEAALVLEYQAHASAAFSLARDLSVYRAAEFS